MWQGRNEEAAAAAGAYRNRIVDPPLIAPLWSALARTQARLGRVALAVRTARDSQRASVSAGPRVAASSELALAEALGAAGDGEGKRAAIARAVRIARASHLPLVRVRAALIHNERSAAMTHRLGKLRLPSLLVHRLEEAAAPVPVHIEPVAEIEKLLDVAQRAADDSTAATHICRVVSERLRATTTGIFGSDRAFAVHGRGWPDVPLYAKQVFACGGSLCSESGHEPRESAEPIRYGGEVIGALACRWVAGVVFDPDTAAVVLRAAALSAAPHIRALLDRPEVPPAAAWGDLLGDSGPAALLREQVSRAARAPFPVLIEGESGSGKELVARALHRFSARRDRRFCALNCAALTDDLVESELFGHARGAFTGAATERPGLFEEADGGTLFLDEIGELSARAQAKLLRVLQEGEVRRVGENFARHVDVRVVAATNRRLEEEVAAGRFRADLRFRLDVVRVIVPPLREPTRVDASCQKCDALARRARGARALRLAGQCARTAERRRMDRGPRAAPRPNRGVCASASLRPGHRHNALHFRSRARGVRAAVRPCRTGRCERAAVARCRRARSDAAGAVEDDEAAADTRVGAR